MSIRKNTNPRSLDLSPELQDILVRNGMQAHITGSSNGFQLVVKGHDSPVLAYNISEKQLAALTDWGTNYANKKAYNTFAELLKNDFDLPRNFVHARNANGRVSMGLHGYRIGEGEYGRMARPYMGWFTDRRHTPFLGWTPRQQEGYHLRRIGGELFYAGAPMVPNRPDGRMKPGELQNGGYGFYYKGQQAQSIPPQKDVLANLQSVIEPVPAVERTTQPATPYKEVITSPVYFTNEKWQEVLASHGLVIDASGKSLTVQSASSPADLQYDLTAAELEKLTNNSLKAVPLKDRLDIINGVIGLDFKEKVTMDTLNSNKSIDLHLTDQAQAELNQQLGIATKQAGLEVRGNEVVQVVPDAQLEQYQQRQTPILDENSVDGRNIEDGKGWFREGAHGREVDVQEIRVEKIAPVEVTNNDQKENNEQKRKPDKTAESEVKYRMTAVINGESISHDITAKQYNKFLALDDEHRMKLFAKIFPEVDIKSVPKEKDPNGLNFGQKLLAGLMAGLGVAREVGHIYRDVHGPRPDIYVSHSEHHLPPPERVYFKPGVDSPMDVAARAYEAQANAEIRHMEMRHGM